MGRLRDYRPPDSPIGRKHKSRNRSGGKLRFWPVLAVSLLLRKMRQASSCDAPALRLLDDQKNGTTGRRTFTVEKMKVCHPAPSLSGNAQFVVSLLQRRLQRARRMAEQSSLLRTIKSAVSTRITAKHAEAAAIIQFSLAGAAAKSAAAFRHRFAFCRCSDFLACESCQPTRAESARPPAPKINTKKKISLRTMGADQRHFLFCWKANQRASLSSCKPGERELRCNPATKLWWVSGRKKKKPLQWNFQRALLKKK